MVEYMLLEQYCNLIFVVLRQFTSRRQSSCPISGFEEENSLDMSSQQIALVFVSSSQQIGLVFISSSQQIGLHIIIIIDWSCLHNIIIIGWSCHHNIMFFNLKVVQTYACHLSFNEMCVIIFKTCKILNTRISVRDICK